MSSGDKSPDMLDESWAANYWISLNVTNLDRKSPETVFGRMLLDIKAVSLC